ncbi:pre-mRNA splicing factor RNA helicase of DEAD box family [Suhomyces tanzawaensis NRRL Y-17324]|uniref:RNA helicase n=1 Tax=Suhomyces tanzawaensis NRRL Y-17324 TaxID=984487 RepID=A0A1E4SGZ1_9ASCO|nr:pre-mRNA splicing factor RNA helicase of DEAD box family [Suhomyces tanzawaensis NRRL Y-17324]ODV78783.1 pre-mRNA splicing factor RNA helicase of DEAD box family [Suhomyces tanzawaensis NRRL Y-17324]
MGPRPVSVEALLSNGSSTETSKPRFLGKLERARLAKLKLEQQEKKKRLETLAKRRPLGDKIDHEEEQETNQSQNQRKKAKKAAHRFNFDWKEDEDTSANYEPLLEVSQPENELELDLVLEKHWSAKELEEMTARDWRIFREDYNITSKGGDIDHPLRDWNEAKIPAKLTNTIVKTLGYQYPTPIQRAAIPVALNHRDIVGIAETGSGKTLAFLIPLLAYILSIDPNYLEYEHQQDSNYNQPLGLILAPTRELALQITKEAQKFCVHLGLNVVSIIGGHQYEETVHSVQNGVHIVVGTPGRLVDSIERNIIGLKRCYYLIMDEADRMIDMGFEKPLQSIMDALPSTEHLNSTIDSRIFYLKKRVTLMFTATISPPIEKITKSYLTKPGYLSIGSAGEAVDNIEQEFEYLGSSEVDDSDDNPRFDKLAKLIKKHDRDFAGNYSVIVFANFKKVCDTLAYKLGLQGYKDSVVLHGSKSQEAREQSIESFRTKKARILIATDVAARGIDIPNVTLVVNFQMPNKFDEYVHRIGRTGRAGNAGLSYSFVDDSNSDLLVDLKKFLVRGRKKCPDWLVKHSSTQNQVLRD